MVYYSTPLHVQTAFAHFGYQPEDMSISMDTSQRIFSLPMHAYLADQDIEKITMAVNEVVRF